MNYGVWKKENNGGVYILSRWRDMCVKAVSGFFSSVLDKVKVEHSILS